MPVPRAADVPTHRTSPHAVWPAGVNRWLAKPVTGWLLFALCLLPLARWFALGAGWGNGFGANPIEFLTRSTGTWTLVALCITLAVTPLRRVAGLHALVQHRRMLGLFVFFYASLHVSTWVWFDHWFSVSEMLKDVVKRPFIAAGFAAFVMLIPLAVTSNRASIRALGRRWMQLHRLVYLVALAAILHYWWHKAGKNALQEPMIYAAVLALLLGIRVVYWRLGISRSRANSSSTDSRSRTTKL